MVVGSGVDVIEIARIARVLAEREMRFVRRVFHPREIEACRACRRPAPHFAIRFAAKEATMKALGTGWARGVRWADIETAPSSPRLSDCLELRLHGAVASIAETLAGGAAVAHLAVSRSRTHAMAVVLLEGAGS